MFFVDTYRECSQAISDQVLSIIKQKDHLFFEKSFFEGNLKKITVGYVGKIKNPISGVYCPEPYKGIGVSYENSPISSKIKKIMSNIPPQKMQDIINNLFSNKKRKNEEDTRVLSLCRFLYCLLVHQISHGIIYSNIKVKDFKFEELLFEGKIFKRKRDLDAMQHLLRSLIWKSIKKSLPKHITIWKLRSNLISLCETKNISSKKKALLVVMEDKRGVYKKYMPEEFVDRFFTVHDGIASLFIDDSTFITRPSETIEMGLLSKKIQVKIDKNLSTQEEKIIPLYKKKNKILKDIAYMMKVSEIFDDVMMDLSQSNVYSGDSIVQIDQLRNYLVEVLFHLPYKKNQISSESFKKASIHQFVNVISYIIKYIEESEVV
jgi:hypothetical protein